MDSEEGSETVRRKFGGRAKGTKNRPKEVIEAERLRKSQNPVGRPREKQRPLTAEEILRNRSNMQAGIEKKAEDRANQLLAEERERMEIEEQAAKKASEAIEAQKITKFRITHTCSKCKYQHIETGLDFFRRQCCNCMLLMSYKVERC